MKSLGITSRQTIHDQRALTGRECDLRYWGNDGVTTETSKGRESSRSVPDKDTNKIEEIEEISSQNNKDKRWAWKKARGRTSK